MRAEGGAQAAGGAKDRESIMRCSRAGALLAIGSIKRAAAMSRGRITTQGLREVTVYDAGREVSQPVRQAALHAWLAHVFAATSRNSKSYLLSSLALVEAHILTPSGDQALEAPLDASNSADYPAMESSAGGGEHTPGTLAQLLSAGGGWVDCEDAASGCIGVGAESGFQGSASYGAARIPLGRGSL